MIELLNNVLLNAQPGTILVMCTTVIIMIILLPKAVNKLGIKKIAGVELSTQEEDYARQYEVSKEVIEIDTRLKESLWEYTEDLLLDFADEQARVCGVVIDALIGHIRAHIMLNHLTTRLAITNEDRFIKKLVRNTRISLNDVKRAVYVECPHHQYIQELGTGAHNADIVMQWIKDARIMVIAACKEKIALYESAVKDSKTDYWKNVFKKCIEKNEAYIESMTVRRGHMGRG